MTNNDQSATSTDDKGKTKKLVDDVLRWFEDSFRTTEEWRAKAIESLCFLSGKQWSDDDLTLLNKQKRPAVVINKLLRPHLFLSGVQRQQRTDASVLAFEPGDARAAEILSYLLKWHGTQSREAYVDSQVFRDMIATGLGYWKIAPRFTADPMGEPRWERVHPLSVFTDPNWFDAGWESARYVLHATWIHIDEAKRRYPQHAEELEKIEGETLRRGVSAQYNGNGESATGEAAGDSLATERHFWDAKTKRIRLLEAWYKDTVAVPVAIDRATGEAVGDQAMVKRLKIASKAMPEIGQQFAFVEHEVTNVSRCLVAGNVLVDATPSPFSMSEFPIWPAVAHYFWQHPFGQTEPGKDPQRAYNRFRSTMLEIVRRSAHAGWQTKKDGGAEVAQLENNLAGVGTVITYDETPAMQIAPPEVPQALVFLMKASDAEIAEVTSVNPEMTGGGTQRTVSGRALGARQRAGLVTQEPLLDSFRLHKEDAVRFMVSAIQQYTSPGKAARILGALAARKPDGPEAMLLQETPEMELDAILGNAKATRFDVVIDPSNKPWEPSIAMARVDQLLEYAEKFPQWVPPDLLIEAMQAAGNLTEDQATRFKAHVANVLAAQGLGQQPQPPQGQGAAADPMQGPPQI